MDSKTRIKDMPDYRGSTGLLAMDSKLYGTGRVSLEHLKQMMGGGPSGTEYESGTGVTVDNENHTISADLAVVQEKLVEGDGISIVGNRISATGGGGGIEYEPGTGIDIDAETHEISVDTDVVATKEDLNAKIDTVDGATSGHVPAFDENGSLTDSGVVAATLVSDDNYVHTDNNYSDDDKSMLAETAEAVQSKQDSLEFVYDENEKIVSIDGHAVGGNDQYILTRSDMTTDFTNAEYQDCVDAVTAGKAVCVQFVMAGITIQAQLTQVTGSGTLVFEFTAENRHYRWEVDFTSDSHTITSKTLKFSVAEPEDWIDITDEWAFVNDFRLQYNDATPGVGNAMTVLYSPAQKIVKFTGGMRINKSSSWNDSDWKQFLQYRGNRFYSSHNAPNFDLAPKVYPRAIGGMVLIPATNSTGGSISALCKLTYTGTSSDSSERCALAMQLFLPANTTIYGAIMEGLQLSVTPIP